MIRTLLAIVVGAALATPSFAQTDHLQCFKVKDSNRRTRYTTGIAGIAPGQGCVIKVPAKLLCVATSEPQVAPAPPGGKTSGGNASAFLCYKTRCRQNTLPQITVADEFGRRLVKPKRSRLLCTPLAGTGADTASSTTTTTTVPTCTCPQTTSTTTHHTTTTSHGAATTTTTDGGGGATTTTTGGGATTTTLGPGGCTVPNTACGNYATCGNGACQYVFPTTELVCAFQNQTHCGGTCASTADCGQGQFCVGPSNNLSGKCCDPCP
jgi:hypothetical protein